MPEISINCRSAKHPLAPSSKIQVPEKLQVPVCLQGEASEHWSLMFLWGLGLGAWSFITVRTTTITKRCNITTLRLLTRGNRLPSWKHLIHEVSHCNYARKCARGDGTNGRCP